MVTVIIAYTAAKVHCVDAYDACVLVRLGFRPHLSNEVVEHIRPKEDGSTQMVMPSTDEGRACEDLGDDRLRVMLYTNIRELTSPGGYLRVVRRISKGDVLWISRPAVICRTGASNGLATVGSSPNIPEYARCAYDASRVAIRRGCYVIWEGVRGAFWDEPEVIAAVEQLGLKQYYADGCRREGAAMAVEYGCPWICSQ